MRDVIDTPYTLNTSKRRAVCKARALGVFFYPCLGLFVAVMGGVTSAQAASVCSAETIQEAVQSERTDDLRLNCSLTLPEHSIIARRVVIEGQESSDLTLDCNGSTISAPEAEPYSLLIRSRRNTDGTWSVPQRVQVRNCTVVGGTRIVGLGINGEAVAVRESSHQAHHTERAQAAAPSDIQFDNMVFQGRGTIPLYLAPGVTRVTVRDSKITGYSRSTAVYLDAESADNTLENNRIDTLTARELVAMDGSARNRMVRNQLIAPQKGGIYVYRNCGEGGTVRHQTPQGNVIADNTFEYQGAWRWRPSVWLGSRQGWFGWRSYCGDDAGYAWGSSVDNGDFADGNQVVNNVERARPFGWMIWNNGQNNQIDGNRRE